MYVGGGGNRGKFIVILEIPGLNVDVIVMNNYSEASPIHFHKSFMRKFSGSLWPN